MTNCGHCGGQALPDVYGELACVQCGRPPEAQTVSLQDCPECGCTDRCNGHTVLVRARRQRVRQRCAVCAGGAWRQRQRESQHWRERR